MSHLTSKIPLMCPAIATRSCSRPWKTSSSIAEYPASPGFWRWCASLRRRPSGRTAVSHRLGENSGTRHAFRSDGASNPNLFELYSRFQSIARLDRELTNAKRYGGDIALGNFLEIRAFERYIA